MTQSSQPISSQTKMLEPCCCSKLLMHRLMQITLLVAGILAIALGYFYLNDMPRLIVMGAGIIACALFVIGVCKASYATARDSKVDAERVEQPRRTKASTAQGWAFEMAQVVQNDVKKFCTLDQIEKDQPVGSALIEAVRNKNRGVMQHVYEGGAPGSETRYAWTVYLRYKATGTLFRQLVVLNGSNHRWNIYNITAPNEGINLANFTELSTTSCDISDAISNKKDAIFEVVDDPFYGKMTIRF